MHCPIQLAEFIALAARVESAAQNAIARIDAKTSATSAVQNALSHYGLLWPSCIDALNYTLASDLQTDTDSSE